MMAMKFKENHSKSMFLSRTEDCLSEIFQSPKVVKSYSQNLINTPVRLVCISEKFCLSIQYMNVASFLIGLTQNITSFFGDQSCIFSEMEGVMDVIIYSSPDM
jgi:hypothetical protein